MRVGWIRSSSFFLVTSSGHATMRIDDEACATTALSFARELDVGNILSLH